MDSTIVATFGTVVNDPPLGGGLPSRAFLIAQQFHLFKAAPLGVNLPPLLVGPLTPLMRAQNDFRRLAFFDPGLSVEGFCDTGGLRFAPVSRLNLARPLAFNPPFRLWRFGLYP